MSLDTTKSEKKEEKECFKQEPSEQRVVRYQSRYVFAKIFSFLPQTERFQYRLISRNFKEYVNYSIDYINLRNINLQMNQYKYMISQFVNLKQIYYPKVYKKVAISTLVAKKVSEQVQKIEGIQFRSHEQVIQLLKYYPKLRSLELNLEMNANNIVDESKELVIDCFIDEIIIKQQSNQDLKILQTLHQQITSLTIFITSENNIIFSLLNQLDQQPTLKKLQIKATILVTQQVHQIQQFILNQKSLEILHIDHRNITILPVVGQIKELKTLILQNVEYIKGLKFNCRIGEIIILSYRLPRKGIKFLLNNFGYFNTIDISGCQGAWFILMLQQGIHVDNQHQTKQLYVNVDEGSLEQLRQIGIANNIKVRNLQSNKQLLIKW